MHPTVLSCNFFCMTIFPRRFRGNKPSPMKTRTKFRNLKKKKKSLALRHNFSRPIFISTQDTDTPNPIQQSLNTKAMGG